MGFVRSVWVLSVSCMEGFTSYQFVMIPGHCQNTDWQYSSQKRKYPVDGCHIRNHTVQYIA